jgi:SSS family solute:Na+ symporter
VAAVLAAAMSSMSSAMNSISAVAITDVYRRHIARGRDDAHYVVAAKLVTLASSIVMIGGAYCLFIWPTKTLQHLSTELTSIIAGGLLGLYMLGFFTRRGDGRHVAFGIVLTTAFSAVISLAGLGWLPPGPTQFIQSHFDAYYTGIFGNLLMFILGYLMARFFPLKKSRDWTNLTVWTQQQLSD